MSKVYNPYPRETEWAWRRLSAMVRAGRSDLRNLRNRLGLAAQGKARASSQDLANARYHIQKGER